MAADAGTLGALVENAQESMGDLDSLYFEGRWHRASDQLDRMRRLTGGLISLGIRPGERVVVFLANSPDVGVVYGGIWRAGAVVTPVVFLLREPELRHVLAHSGAAAVITSPEFLGTVRAAATGAPGVRHIVLVGGELPADAAGAGATVVSVEDLVAGPPVERVPRTQDDLGALMYTGGTTGRSKGVMLSHGNLFESGRSSWEGGKDRMTHGPALVALPLSHAFGMIVTVVGAHRTNDGVLFPSVLMRWFDPAGWLKLAAEHRIVTAPLVPSMVAILLGQPLEEHDLSALRYLTVGAAPLPGAVLAEFERRVPNVTIFEGYGCTESGAVISSSVPDRKVGAVGTPIPRYEVEVRDDAGNALPVGQDGEICARGPGIMQGYWDDPEATAVALKDGWLHTGDIGRLDEDGYITLIDRKKDLIIRGGFNVYPRDVEDALTTHPDVTMAAVVGRPDPVSGEEVVAFVSLVPGATTTPEQLIEYAKTRLAGYRYPREVHIVEAVPLTSVGKVDRKALRVKVTAPAGTGAAAGD